MLAPDIYWLALRRVKGIGPRIARLLLERFGTAPAVFSAGEEALIAAGVNRPVARAITEFSDFAPLDRELCELARLGGRLVKWTDEDYPEPLRHIADPPPLLYVRGRTIAGERQCVAVVGARAASEAALHMAHRLGSELASKGLTVVSGLARGIDGQAHRGALEVRGRTIAVLGCGIDIIYPPEHRKLAEELIGDGGALFSELPVGTPPLAENFPTRNRIISGLCLGVIIVEAAERSGSLITARTALEQDRQVFAVPGSPLNGRSRGSNRLIKEGAKLVECVEDVIEDLAPQLDLPKSSSGGQPASAGEKSSLLISTAGGQQNMEVLMEPLASGEKMHIDALVEKSGLDTPTALGLLLELELSGLVAQHPGKLFSLKRI